MENSLKYIVAGSLLLTGCNGINTIPDTSSVSFTPTLLPTETSTPTQAQTETPMPSTTLNSDQQTATMESAYATATPIDATKVASINTAAANISQLEGMWNAQVDNIKEIVVKIETKFGTCSGTILRILPLPNSTTENYVVFLKSSAHCFFSKDKMLYNVGERLRLQTVSDYESNEDYYRFATYISSVAFGGQTDQDTRHSITALILDKESITGLSELNTNNLGVYTPQMTDCKVMGFPTNNEIEQPLIDTAIPIKVIDEHGTILTVYSSIVNRGMSGGPMLCTNLHQNTVDVGELQYKYMLDPNTGGISIFKNEDLVIVETIIQDLLHLSDTLIN